MNNIRKSISRKILIVQQVAALMLFSILVIHAVPTSNFNQNKSDQTSRSAARIDPVTLGLNIEIPLGSYPGRGGANIPLTINYSSKVWTSDVQPGFQSPCLDFDPPCTNGINRPDQALAVFGNDSMAGWTSSLKVPKVVYTGKFQPFGQNGEPSSCPECANQVYIQRIHIYLPDGSAHELRKSDVAVDLYNNTDWSGTYYAVDGSQMRYETESKTLFMPDGSRYIIHGALLGNDNSLVGNSLAQNIYDNYRLTQPAEYIDRNGNKLTYDPTTKKWTDALGREFGSPFPADSMDLPGYQNTPNRATEGDVNYLLPGMGTGTVQYTFKWKKLSDVFSNSSYQVHYPGSQSSNRYNPPLSPALFENTASRGTFNPVVLAEIVLPDNTSYKFGYNPYGEIDKFTYPTGAYEKFTYSSVIPISWQTGYSPFFGIDEVNLNRGVTEHSISAKGDGTDAVTTYYTAGFASTSFPPQLPYKSTVTNPDGTITERLIHAEVSNFIKYGFDAVPSGNVYEERLLRGTTMLRRTLTDWMLSGPQTGGLSTATRNPRVTRQTEILFEGTDALAKSTMYTYDAYQNVNSTVEYGFVSVNYSTAQNVATTIGDINIGTKKRTTEVDYKNDAISDAAYISRHIVGLPKETRILNANDQVVAKSQIFYDEPNYSVLSYSGTPTQWENPGTSPRGNATTTKNYSDITNNQYITTHAQYDQFGNLRYSWDGRGSLSQTEYSSTFNYAYPTRTLSPKPDPNGVTGSATELETSTDYDFRTGLVKSVTDANGQTTYNSYSDPVSNYIDPLLRLRKVTAPNGQQTITEYGIPNSNGQLDASQRFVKVKTQVDATNWKQRYTWTDGLGRTIKTQSISSSGDVFVLSCYDNIGRLEKVSNPSRNIPDAICDTNLEWTINTYDDLGRVTKVKTPDNAEVNTVYSLAASTSSGATLGLAVTITDQALKQRRSITNAFGQLIRVDEPTDTNGLGGINSPNQPTHYTYDTLNNLITVQQNGTDNTQCGGASATCSQTRTFVYDALSRIKSATNPEMGTTPINGTVTYQYDNNSNLLSKTDARGVLTAYVHDALNRIVSKSYSNEPTGQITTPSVNYTYDDLLNARGKVTKMTTTRTGTNAFTSVTEYQVFDEMGRVKQSEQKTDGTEPGAIYYTYNLSGALVEQKYPSGRVVKNVLDNDGDLSVVKSKKNLNTGYWNYADSFTYTAAGAVSSMQLGNGKWESTVFNSRLQPTQIALGTVQNGTDKLKLNFAYSTPNNNDNSGNILNQTITVPTETRGGNTYNGFVATQNYTYDTLNRLQSAEETIPSQTGWKQTFKYDRYGNRRFEYGSDPATPLTTIPKAQSMVPKVSNPEALASNNRFKEDQDNDNVNDYIYDEAGNLIRNAEYKKFIYDAEDKQIRVETVNSSGTTLSTLGEYFYDGDGKRVKKKVGDEITIFIYDISGRLLAEYDTTVTPTLAAQTNYLTSDYLGSPRISTDQNGNVLSRHDYQPFGEEIQAVPGETARTGYNNDDVRKQFTSYERDIEIDLDFAQGRYYNSKHGRFTSADSVGPDLYNPQTLNKYQYCLNNPLRFIDENGKYEEEVHRDLTVVLAYAAGFYGNEATDIGAADQWVDDNPETEPYNGINARIQYHFTTESTRDGHWARFESFVANGDGQAYAALGTFMHPQQDSFSHEGFGPVAGQGTAFFDNPLGLNSAYEEARKYDDTTYDPGKAERMAADTFSRLLRARNMMANSGKFGVFRKPIPYSIIAKEVAKWARAKTPAEKKASLNNMLIIINAWEKKQNAPKQNTQKRKKTKRVTVSQGTGKKRGKK